jgi:hypothetical protein
MCLSQLGVDFIPIQMTLKNYSFYSLWQNTVFQG